MLFQVRDQFSASNFPNADLALHASRTHEFVVRGEADGRDSTLMGVLDLPEEGAVVDPISADEAVAPPRDDDFVGEDGAEGVDAASALGDAVVAVC